MEPPMAAKRADALIGLGDVDEQDVWEVVLHALLELLRRDRRLDERVN
jgi:hypothetical protein